MKKGILAALALLAVLTIPARAAVDPADLLGVDRLEEAAAGYVDGVDLDGTPDVAGGLGRIWQQGKGQVCALLSQAVRSGCLLVVIALFCGAAQAVRESFGGAFGIDVVSMAGAAGVAAAAAADVHSLMAVGSETIQRIWSFAALLLPVVASAAAAGGGPAEAAARQGATLLFANLLITAIQQWLLPLTYAYLAVSMAYAAVGNEGLRAVGRLLKWVVVTALTLLVMAFVGYLSVTGAVAGTADAAAVKAARFAISGMVPVVGGILSDASETVLAGAGVLKGAVGVFGMLAVLAFCFVPFLQLAFHYLAYKAAAVLTSALSAGRVGGLIGDVGNAFALVLGMTGASAVLLLVSLVASVNMAAP